VAFTYSKGTDAAASVVKEMNAAAERQLQFRRMPPTRTPSRPRSKRPSRPSATGCPGEQCGTAIPKPFEETTLEEMDRVIDINIRGVFVATQAALKHMKMASHHHDRFGCGERVAAPGLVPYAGTKEPSRCSLRRWPEKSEPGHHGQQRAAGSD